MTRLTNLKIMCLNMAFVHEKAGQVIRNGNFADFAVLIKQHKTIRKRKCNNISIIIVTKLHKKLSNLVSRNDWNKCGNTMMIMGSWKREENRNKYGMR